MRNKRNPTPQHTRKGKERARRRARPPGGGRGPPGGGREKKCTRRKDRKQEGGEGGGGQGSPLGAGRREGRKQCEDREGECGGPDGAPLLRGQASAVPCLSASARNFATPSAFDNTSCRARGVCVRVRVTRLHALIRPSCHSILQKTGVNQARCPRIVPSLGF